jgi:glycosyltransferase involved in cell wall biosynthesis
VTDEAAELMLLIPAYNEEQRVGPVLRDYVLYFREHYQESFRLVVVLNGCRDNTLKVVLGAAEQFPEISHLEFSEPIGKGGALIEGLKLAPHAELIGYVDADGATKPAAFLELVALCAKADCVIGSRWLPGSILHMPQSAKRQFSSRVFHTIVHCLFRLKIRDTQCGAKVMHRHAVEAIHSKLTIADMAFDINLLVSLKRAGFKILEVPTEWTDKVGTKVQYFKTSLVMLLSVIRLRLIYSPFYRMLKPIRPLEAWIYRTLSAPPPRSGKESTFPNGERPEHRPQAGPDSKLQ